MEEITAKILYVEDDVTLSYVTKDNLIMRGYSVDYCEDGEQGLKSFKENVYHLCILDVMLPKMDGFTLATKIREINPDVPIIFLTAKSTIDDKLEGLKLGGDDYITKPFSIEELVLKIEVFLKRNKLVYPENTSPKMVSAGMYKLEMDKLSLTTEKGEQSLTYKEAELVRLFFQNIGTILKRDEILKAVWDDDSYFAGRSMDVFISRIRKYIKGDPRLKLENIHGVGFRLEFHG